MKKSLFIAAVLLAGSLAHAQKARHEDWMVDLSST